MIGSAPVPCKTPKRRTERIKQKIDGIGRAGGRADLQLWSG
jgi:hypothetical protein